jgi:hypothetical protein
MLPHSIEWDLGCGHAGVRDPRVGDDDVESSRGALDGGYGVKVIELVSGDEVENVDLRLGRMRCDQMLEGGCGVRVADAGVDNGVVSGCDMFYELKTCHRYWG